MPFVIKMALFIMIKLYGTLDADYRTGNEFIISCAFKIDVQGNG